METEVKRIKTEIGAEEIPANGEQTAGVESSGGENQTFETEKNGGNFFKSFKTKEDLCRAYESLEKEFTRKSQELSERKKGREFDAGREAERFFGEFPDAAEYAEEIAETLEKSRDLDSGAIERAYLKVLKRKTEDRGAFVARAASDREIREKVVLDYLKNLPTSLPVLTTGGRSPSTEPKRAKTLSEAGNEALHILKR